MPYTGSPGVGGGSHETHRTNPRRRKGTPTNVPSHSERSPRAPVGVQGPSIPSGRRTKYRVRRKTTAARLASHYKSEFKGVPIGTGRKSDPAQEITRQILTTKRARSTNRRAELGLAEHPNMPHGLTAAIGDLIPDTPAEIALAAATGGAGKVVGAALKARKLAKAAETAETVAKAPVPKAASKVPPHIEEHLNRVRLTERQAAKVRGETPHLKSVPEKPPGKVVLKDPAHPEKGWKFADEPKPTIKQRVANRPRPVKTAKAKVAETKPGQAASKAANAKTIKVLRKGSRVTTRTAAVTAPVAAAASGAHSKGGIGGATAPFVGTAKALTHPKTYLTTVEGAPSIVTAPLGIAEGLALTGARAGATATGLKHYSGEEITTPTTKQVGALTDYAKGLAKTYGSGDAKKIEQATEKDYGLWPAAMVGFPAAHVGRKLHVGERVGEHVPEVVKARTSKPIKEKAAGRRHRRREAQQYAQRKTKEARVTRAATHPIQVAMERVKGTKRLTHHRGGKVAKKGHVEPGDTLPLVHAEGIDLSHPNAPRQLAEVQKHYQDRPVEATAEDVVPHDILNALQGEGELGHKTLAKSEKYSESRAAAQANSKLLESRDQPYTRAKYFHQAKTWGIPLPDERFVKDRQALVIKHGQRAANDAQLHFDMPDEHPIKNLKKGTRAYVEAVQKIDAKANAAFVKDMKDLRAGKIKGKEHAEGLVEPHYIRDVKAGEPPVPVAGRPSMEQQSRVMHQKTGAIRRSGMQDMSFKTFLRETVARPHKLQIAHADAARFAAEDNIRIPYSDKIKNRTGPEVTSHEYRAWAKENPKAAEDVMLVDRQKYKQALSDPNISPEEKVRLASEAVEQDQIKRDMANPLLKGRRYLVKPRAKVEEFVAQRTPETVGAGNRLWRWPFHAVLAYSPPWLLSQPIAESSIAALSKNPITQFAATRAAKGKGVLPFEKVGEPLSAEARHEISSHAQSTAGTGWRTEDKQTSNKLTEGLDQLKRSRTGRTIWSALTGEATRKADLWKGGKINEGQFLAKAYHDLGHGPLRRLGKSLKLIESLDAELQKAGGNFAKEMEILSKRSGEMERIGNYVYDTHGDWNSIIKSGKFNEKMAAKWLTFYPFLRFSTLWFLRYGRQHPAKAAALSALANQNEQVLRKMYGGAPNFPTGWANAPIYAGTGKNLGKPTKGLGPLGARVSPSSNVLTEQIMQGASPGGALSALNPWVGALVQAGTGINPLSGRQQPGQEGWPGPGQFAKSLGANIASWPQLLREVDAATGKKVSRSLHGRQTSQTGLIYDTISGQATNPLAKAIRDTVGIFLPSDTAKMRQAAEVSRLFARKFNASQDLTANQAAFLKAVKDRNQHDAIDIGRRALLAEQASNRLDLFARQLGIPQHTWSDAESAFMRAAGGELVIPMNRNDILDALDKAGIKYPNVPPFRPRKARRARS